MTRLTGPTVSLICLACADNGAYRLTHNAGPVSSLAIRKISQGGFEDIGRLMLAEVTSTHRGLINELRDGPRTPPEWADTGLLCRHHLIVFAEGKARVGRYDLLLDNEIGLTITRVNDQGEDE